MKIKKMNRGGKMKKVIIVICILSIVCLTNINAQGKAVESEVSVTNTAEVGGDTKEAKTIRVEEQVPGVITEYKEDGTKVVTINLSEVDEDKLPEKYEAEVILEAPIYTDDYIYKNKEKLKGQIYFMEAVDAAERIDFDVSIDEMGNIYIYDPYMSRIQKFNNKGRHIRNIPIREVSEGYYDKRTERLVHKTLKTKIAVGKGKIYIRDTAKNRIEAIDESGNVIETIEIPETIDGKSTREMRMWADEEGVGVGEKEFKKENGKVKIKNRKMQKIEIKEISKQKRQINIGNMLINFISEVGFIQSQLKNIDKNNNMYFINSTGNQKTSGIYKITDEGLLLTKIAIWPYYTLEKWKNGCKNFFSIAKESIQFDKNRNIYILQGICCYEKYCVGKIRIIKLNLLKDNK